MGLLSQGHPLKWKASKKHHAAVKKHGIIQFIKLFQHYKGRHADKFLWGDEIEGFIVVMNKEKKTVRISLRAPQILAQLQRITHDIEAKNEDFHARFLPEYGSYMIEATPGAPYGNTTADLRLVEPNMRLRRNIIESMLLPNERMTTMGNFPLMGVGSFTEPAYAPTGPAARSQYLPDQLISPHPRFATLTQNIRTRRQSRVDIRIPRYQDSGSPDGCSPCDEDLDVVVKETEPEEKTAATVTPLASVEPAPSKGKDTEQEDPEPVYEDAKETDKEIHMDAMGFGMGSCCLQVTFQARSLHEARHVYDQLAVLSPILLALTAATPFWKGLIADIDVRWTVISQSVDDRTPEERGLKPLPADGSQMRIHKSRYDSISSYLSLEPQLKDKYNDLPLEINKDYYQQLIDGGVDHLMAQHIAHLWIRDPLVIYEESVEVDDDKSSEHFENIQSTNWQSVRFKPPPPNVETGWRVEFRTMEIQITDFENAAFTTFIALLQRAILMFKLNFYMPLSKVDENMKIAHKRDAARTEKFYWRLDHQTHPAGAEPDKADDFSLMTMEEIVCGTKQGNFPGLIPIVRAYLEAINCDAATLKVMNEYLELIGGRAEGRLLTTAQFYRNFVCHHPSYKFDSKLTEDIVYDLTQVVAGIEKGRIAVPRLLGNVDMKARQQTPVKAPEKATDWPSPSANLVLPTSIETETDTETESNDATADGGHPLLRGHSFVLELPDHAPPGAEPNPTGKQKVKNLLDRLLGR